MAFPKGHRYGGRQKGTPNKKTQQRLLQVAMDQHDSAKGRKKLAKDVLEDFMHLTAGMAAMYQPRHPDAPQNPHQNEEKFWKCVELTRDFATALAKYQSPTFKAIAVQTQPPSETEPVTINQDGKNVIALNDPVALTRLYRMRITQVRG